MAKRNLQTKKQASAYSSPWSLKYRVGIMLWALCSIFLFRPTPKFLSPWRVFLLKLFGAQISGRVFVSESARIKFPWNLAMEHRACIGPYCDIYNLAMIHIGKRATVSRHVYLCGGEHDTTTSLLPLVTGPIKIGADVFIGSNAFVAPGVSIGEGAVIGACSVVVADAPAWKICVGNPCKAIRDREFKG